MYCRAIVKCPSDGPARCSRCLVSATCYLRIAICGLWSPSGLTAFSARKWAVCCPMPKDKFTGSLAGQHKALQGHPQGKESIDLLSLPLSSLSVHPSIHPSVHPSTVWGPHFGHISSRKTREQVMPYSELGQTGRGSRKRSDLVLGVGVGVAGLSPSPLTSLAARLSEPVFPLLHK